MQTAVTSILYTRAANDLSVFTIMEKALTRVFSWLKAPTSAFTFRTIKTLCYMDIDPTVSRHEIMQMQLLQGTGG